MCIIRQIYGIFDLDLDSLLQYHIDNQTPPLASTHPKNHQEINEEFASVRASRHIFSIFELDLRLQGHSCDLISLLLLHSKTIIVLNMNILHQK